MEFFAIGAVLLGVTGLIVLLIGTASRGISAPSFTDYPDAIQTAAFRFIGMPSLWPSYLGGQVKQIAERRALIARKRREAEALNNPELRACVRCWLDYYERKLPAEERELVEKISRRELDAYTRRTARQSAEATRILRNAQGTSPGTAETGTGSGA